LAGQRYSPVEVEVEVERVPVPYGLLALEQELWGQLAFETDAEGQLAVVFSRTMLEADIVLRVLTKPEGQDLLEETFLDSTFEVDHGSIRMSW
jgi:hypothetical protein